MTETSVAISQMNLELSKVCMDNAELRTDIKRMLNERRDMIEEYNRLHVARQSATDESRQLTSECSESFANRCDRMKLAWIVDER